MVKHIKHIVIFILALIAIYSSSISQVPEGYLREVRYLENNDTLIAHRNFGDWWIGGFAGPNINLFFGDLFSYYNPLVGEDEFNPKISFSNTFGGGYYFGGQAEYRPQQQRWGYMFGLTFLDRKVFSTLTGKMGDELETQFQYRSVLDYLILSPTIKYYTTLEGLYYYTGVDVGINTGAVSRQRKRFINSGDIEHWLKLPSVKANTRIEFNLGAGYEFLLADFAGMGRIMGNPYASLNAGSNIITNLKSSWNAIGFKVGFAMRFAKDKVKYDTLKFDTDYVPPPEFFAQVDLAGVEFPGFTHSNPLPAAVLSMVSVPIILEDLAELPQFNEELHTTGRPIQVRRRIVPDQMVVFNFDKPETTNLSNEIEQYLDLLTDFLKANPRAEVRITGHSDNQGTLQQRTERANNRATNVRTYLVRKGIAANRVLSTGRGALIPVAPNDTPANQRRNRRVEIVVVG